MNARQANKSEEEWIMNSLEKNGLDDTDVNYEEFVFVFDESVSNDPIAYGRIKEHTEEEEVVEKKENVDEDSYIRYNWYEITSIFYSPVVEKKVAAKSLLQALLTKFKQLSSGESDTVLLFEQETSLYESFGFTHVSDEDLQPEQQDRWEEKQTSNNKKQTRPLRLTLSEFDSSIESTEDSIQSEKEKQGFSDSSSQSHKYST